MKVCASSPLSLFAVICLLPAGLVRGAGDPVAEIDALLAASWKAAGVEAAPPASDEVFVRRAYLDLVGRIPTRGEALAFLNDSDGDKRDALVGQLLESEGHAAHLFHFWADLLRLNSRAHGGQGQMTAKPYVAHVRRRVGENMPYDEFVRELLSAQGKVWENPAIGYYMRDIGMPLDNLALTSRIFLGTRIECAQCHNHPFDKWSQMDFYRLAAYAFPQETNYTGIAGMEGALDLHRAATRQREALIKTGAPAQKAAAEAEAEQARWVGKALDDLGDFVRYSKVKSLPRRQLELPHDYQYDDAKPGDRVAAATLFGAEAPIGEGTDGVEALARWVTSPDNPRFTQVIVNRLWKRAFGMGLIEPVDEIVDSTQASHPELLARLEKLMIELDYDLRAFQRVIYRTRAYQAETVRREPVPGERPDFTGPYLRRLTAEQIWDSFVTLVHHTPDLPRYRGIDPETRDRIAYRSKLSDALDTLTDQELFVGAMEASKAYQSISQRATGLREEFAAATKAKDKERAEQLSNEIRGVEYRARSSVNDHLVVPAVARLYTQITGKAAPPPPVDPAAAGGPGIDFRKASQQRPYIDVPGYESAGEAEREEAAAAEAREAVFAAEADRFGLEGEARERYLKSRRDHAREWVRAADIESPAPRGHYLREFGQSDRDLVENANLEATMPQALVLMNSPLSRQILSTHTQLSDAIAGAATPDEQAAAVYLAILSRRPTAGELSTWAQMRGQGLDRIEDLVFALVNSRQFLFIR
ncbi:MAG: DUF1549 domain-containing protein [Verrucomicrobiales bacterium]|nr:DUF1549 domain-containing protein [Verrucomicrobiales bacterium]